MNWIRAEKIRPQTHKDVLIWVQHTEIGHMKVAYLKKYSGYEEDEKECYLGWYSSEHDWGDDKGENRIKEGEITHWMPLPDGPEEI